MYSYSWQPLHDLLNLLLEMKGVQEVNAYDKFFVYV